jgi:bifunctional non-homologous end joining protein LigD
MEWRSSAAPKRQPPGFIEPCIPTLVSQPPVGPRWAHEIKHDSYRLIARKRDGRVRLFTRRGYDGSDRYQLILHSARRLPVSRFLIDGEAVCCIDDGLSDFDRLHSRAQQQSPSIKKVPGVAARGAKAMAEISIQESGICSIKLIA